MQICVLTRTWFLRNRWSKKNGPSGPDYFFLKWLYFELMICDKYRGKNTGPQSVKMVSYKMCLRKHV
jgi:hypothetical protein